MTGSSRKYRLIWWSKFSGIGNLLPFAFGNEHSTFLFEGHVNTFPAKQSEPILSIWSLGCSSPSPLHSPNHRSTFCYPYLVIFTLHMLCQCPWRIRLISRREMALWIKDTETLMSRSSNNLAGTSSRYIVGSFWSSVLIYEQSSWSSKQGRHGYCPNGFVEDP